VRGFGADRRDARSEAHRARHGVPDGVVDPGAVNVDGVLQLDRDLLTRRRGGGRQRQTDARVVLLEQLERALSPHVVRGLLHEERPLDVLRLHRFRHLPRRDVAQQLARPRRAARQHLLPPPHVRRVRAFAHRHRGLDERQNFGRHEEANRLANADPAHAVRALGVVAPHHPLAEREHRLRVERVLDVHARRMNLIVEREAPRRADAALLQPLHFEPLAHEHHLAVRVVEKDDAVAVEQTRINALSTHREEVPRHLFVRHARYERSRVDECPDPRQRASLRPRRRDRVEDRSRRPLRRRIESTKE
jgi:hypothetical protein